MAKSRAHREVVRAEELAGWQLADTVGDEDALPVVRFAYDTLGASPRFLYDAVAALPSPTAIRSTR